MPSPKRKWLVVRLSGPMISFGQPGRSNRPTYEFATKSMFVGFVANAMGSERHDREIIAEISSLDVTSFRLRLAGVMEDYNTVGCGYKDKSSMPLTFDGGRKQMVTRRHYLEDADFILVAEGEEELVERCATALDEPARPLFLGRKGCLPVLPPVQGVFSSEDDAMECVMSCARIVADEDCRGLEAGIPFVRDCLPSEANDVVLDHPVVFGQAFGGHKRRFVEHGILAV